MLNNPLGVFLYLMLRNDLGWRLLSASDKERIIKANIHHNISREDYASPSEYGKGRMVGGENWDSWKDNCCVGSRYRVLSDVLDKIRPSAVLEIGPGAGYYTRLICEHVSVQRYAAIDIGRSFLDYLQPRLQNVGKQKRFSFDLICGDATHVDLSEKYELVVLLSAVHHIPNRIELFSNLARYLHSGGKILCCDPSHYLIRWFSTLRNCIRRGWLKKEYYSDTHKLGTHHMCTRGEYRNIVKAVGDLRIESIRWVLPSTIQRYRWLFIPNYLWSTEIIAVIEKQ